MGRNAHAQRTGRSGYLSSAYDGERRSRRRALRGAALALVLALGASLGAGVAHADEYDPERAGHPLRLLAYVLHPVGVAADYLVFRPAHAIVHYEPFRTIFGHEEP